MATELKKLTVDASNGSYTFEVVDAEARETANAAKTAAEGISIPTALPNPNKLTFTGGATGTYDGSKPVTINIPTGGESSGSGPIQYIESLDESNLANLRDLETGTYVLYGYFYPFAGAADTLTCDNTLVSVAHLSAGSHVLVFNPLNCKVNFVEILVDESAEGGHTYSVDLIDMRDLNALIAMVGELEGLNTTEKTSLVAAINEVAANAGGSDYTLPIGGDELGGVKNGGNVTINEDGTMTAPESEVTDEQVATAVSDWLEANPDATTTVQDGSITQEKLADDAVTPEKTSFWGSAKPYIIGDNYPCQPVEVLPYRGVRTLGSKGWYLYLCERNADTENVKVFPVKAGTLYTILPSNSVLAYYCTSYTVYEPTEADLTKWEENKTYTGSNVLAKMLDMPGNVGLVSTQNYTSTSKFRYTPEQDGFIIMASVGDASMLFEGASNFKIYENFLDKVYAGEYADLNTPLYTYASCAFELGEKAKGMFCVKPSDEFQRLLRMGNYWDDIHGSTIRLFVMGDSITWAASNVGADKAYRTLLSNKYSITHYSASQNDTTITAGLGASWTADQTTYDKGVDGLIEAHLSVSKEETVDDERTDPRIMVAKYSVFTIAFGTNDFRYNAPIGTIDDTDSTTFMGGYKKLIARIRELYPDSSIILCTPWKQTNWDVANEAGHYLVDYNLAIHEIASKTRKCFVLDMFDNPYINGAGNARPGVYVDGVHLGKYGHILIAEELEKLILQCIMLKGYPFAKTNLPDSWTGL